jgi:hypothetical protein
MLNVKITGQWDIQLADGYHTRPVSLGIGQGCPVIQESSAAL